MMQILFPFLMGVELKIHAIWDSNIDKYGHGIHGYMEGILGLYLRGGE